MNGDVPPVPGLKQELGVSGLKPEGMGVFYQAPARRLLHLGILEDSSYRALLAAHQEPSSDEKEKSAQLKSATEALLKAHDLDALARTTRERARGATSETQGVVDRAVATLEYFRDAALVRRGMKPEMSLEDIVPRSTGSSLESIDSEHLAQVQAELKAALGVVLGRSVDALPLHESLARFRQDPRLNFPQSEVQRWFEERSLELEALTRERILPALNLDVLGLDPSVTSFSRLNTNFVPGVYSLHLYTGTEVDGRPQFDGELSIATGTAQEPTLNDPLNSYTLAHEAFPGHHLHSTFLDAATRKGILPSMSAFGVMPGPALGLAEGWAMSAPFALYPEEGMPPSIRVAMSASYLGALGGLHAVRRRFLDKAEKEVVGGELIMQFGAKPERVKSFLDLPRDFQMGYRPIYVTGIRAVMEAIRKYGLPGVAQAILTPKSPIDLNLFKQKFPV